jgi:hypothetical protein
MTDNSYLPEVECIVTVENGMADTQVVKVSDETNDFHFLRVGKGVVAHQGEKAYLPVGIVPLDRRRNRVLVKLPQEADSGVRPSRLSLCGLRRTFPSRGVPRWAQPRSEFCASPLPTAVGRGTLRPTGTAVPGPSGGPNSVTGPVILNHCSALQSCLLFRSDVS